MSQVPHDQAKTKIRNRKNSLARSECLHKKRIQNHLGNIFSQTYLYQYPLDNISRAYFWILGYIRLEFSPKFSRSDQGVMELCTPSNHRDSWYRSAGSREQARTKNRHENHRDYRTRTLRWITHRHGIHGNGRIGESYRNHQYCPRQ